MPELREPGTESDAMTEPRLQLRPPRRSPRYPTRRCGVPPWRLLLAGLVLTAIAAGCAATDPGETGTDVTSGAVTPSTLDPSRAIPTVDVNEANDDAATPKPDAASMRENRPSIDTQVDIGDAKQPRPYDDVLAAAIADNDQWWSEVFPRIYGARYRAIEGRIYAGYPERSDTIPGCSGATETAHDDLAAYVAFYCADTDFFAYDDADTSALLELSDRYGPNVVGVVISHEWAHAIQNRAGILGQNLATVHTEQHADCVAGAWVARAADGESPLVSYGDTEVTAALAAIAEVRDPVGTSQFTGDGHGSAFDRLGAFQVGFDEGVARCAELIDTPLPLTQNEFMPNTGDAARDGNAPFDCDEADTECSAAPDFISRDLNEYWADRLNGFDHIDVVTTGVSDVDDANSATCETESGLNDWSSICREQATIRIDGAQARAVHETVGDFALGYLLGVGFADAALTTQGSTLTGADRALARDCLTGQWIADITPDGSGKTARGGAILSPGDLDETIDMIFDTADDSAAVDQSGTAVQKIGALRAGVYEQNCDDYLTP